MGQLMALGLGRPAVSKRVRAGRLHRVERGVYAVGHPALSRHGRWMAAVLASGERAVLSHVSAAVLWGAWRGSDQVTHVTTPDRRRSRPGLRVHRARSAGPDDVTEHEAIPVTTLARTLVDLGAILEPLHLANVIHEAAFHGRFDAAATRAAMGRAHGHNGLGVLRRALAAHEDGSAGTRSGLEHRFLALIRGAGLPEPRVNTRVAGIEVDFHWPAARLCVEIDGPGHERPRTRREDRARERALRGAGQRVIRLTAVDLDRPEAAIARVRTALDG